MMKNEKPGPKCGWNQEPTYNPGRLIKELKKRRDMRTNAELAALLGIPLSYLRDQANGSRPIGFSMVLRVTYEFTELTIDGIFELMGVPDASKYLSGE